MKLIEKYVSENNKHTIYKFLGIKLKIANRYNLNYLNNRIETLEEQVNALFTILNSVIDITQIPKAKGELRQRQIESLKIFKTVHQVLEENKICYWIEAGTLLGAVRHKGFVPWDDDMDISMLRQDAYKAIPLLKQAFEGTDYYVREVCKIAQNFQIRIIKKDANEIGMDIFIFDKYFKGNLSETEKNDITADIKNAQELLVTGINNNNYFNFDINAIRTYIENTTKTIILKGNEINEDNPAIFYGIDYPYKSANNLIVNNDTIFPLKNIEFEDMTLPCPNNMEEYLENQYGKDYMKFPEKIVWE